MLGAITAVEGGLVPAAAYPVRLQGRPDPGLSRWLWLVKWLLVIPHLLVLTVLWIAFAVLALVAIVAVAVSGRYPPRIFAFNLGVLRWTWRVAFYAYGALATDRYPPFTLADVPEYPARLDIPYPEHLPRGLALVRWWVIALPQYVVACVLMGTAWIGPLQGGTMTVLALLGGIALLVTGTYPRPLLDLILGLNRWVMRACAYGALMTDAYPPMRLDSGDEPIGELRMPASGSSTPAAGPRSRPVMIVSGAVAVLVALGLLAAGGALVAADVGGRDGDGFISTGRADYSTSAFALVTAPDALRLESVAGVAPADLLGTVRLRVHSDEPVFAGVGRTEAVRTYLAGVERTVLDDVGTRDGAATVAGGGAPPVEPGRAGIWAASTSGTGSRAVTWRPRSGSWSVVVMRPDGGRGVRATLSAGARAPHLGAIGAGLLAGGVLLGCAGAGLLLAGLGTGGGRRD